MNVYMSSSFRGKLLRMLVLATFDLRHGIYVDRHINRVLVQLHDITS